MLAYLGISRSQEQRERELPYLHHKGAKLGFDLMPKELTLVPTPA